MSVSRRSVLLITLLVSTSFIWLAGFVAQPLPQVVGHYVPPEWPQPDGTDLERHGANTRLFMLSPCDSAIADGMNEVHDCQRLIRRGRDGRPEFGPLVGVIPDLNALRQGTNYFSEPRVVARITNASDDAYVPLRIGGRSPGSDYPAGSCLWLVNDERTGSWRAAIQAISPRPETGRGGGRGGSPRPDLTGCGEVPGTFNLLVRRQIRFETDAAGRVGPAPIERYPQTARWGWSELDDTHYIGLNCVDAWCDIGVPGFRAPRIQNSSEEVDARRAIPGWFDAQYLAVPDTQVVGGNTTVVLRPGPWATVYPLQLPTNPNWSNFQAVARVVFASDPGPYAEKFHLSGFPNQYSTIELRRSSPTPEARYRNSEDGIGPAHGVTRGADGTDHGPHGAVRFRWRIGDETIWVPCPDYGCCDVEEDGG